MASWSNIVDREKWRLALLGGIEVRRSSGNEEAGNGGSGGAGGLSKPKYFRWSSMLYPIEVLEHNTTSILKVSVPPSATVADHQHATLGIISATWTEKPPEPVVRPLGTDMDFSATTLRIISTSSTGFKYTYLKAEDEQRTSLTIKSASLVNALIRYNHYEVESTATTLTIKGAS